MKRRLLVVIVVIGLLLAGGWAIEHFYLPNGRNTLPWQYYSSQPGDASALPPLNHVVIIVEENKPRTQIIGNADAPYLNSIANQYATATNYYAVTHPSLPNYIALTSGTTAGIDSDCNPPSPSCQADVPNIADRLEAGHKTWRAYLDGMPAACSITNSGDYAVKHNPFLYFPDIRTNYARCAAHDVPFSQLAADLAADTLPDYSFISPDLCHDMHNCSVATGDQWLAAYVPGILQSSAFTRQHSLLVITWDEGDEDSNNVPAIFAGPAARQHSTSANYYSHYSLLHTIEAAWHLAPLTGNDRTAPLMTAMLRQ